MKNYVELRIWIHSFSSSPIRFCCYSSCEALFLCCFCCCYENDMRKSMHQKNVVKRITVYIVIFNFQNFLIFIVASNFNVFYSVANFKRSETTHNLFMFDSSLFFCHLNKFSGKLKIENCVVHSGLKTRIEQWTVQKIENVGATTIVDQKISKLQVMLNVFMV